MLGSIQYSPTSAFTIAVVFSLPGCQQRYDGKQLVLQWADPNAGIVFRITEDPSPIVKQNSRLHVSAGGRDQVVMIDDDAVFSTAAFVRYQNFLLVVCRGVDEVWAGYDYGSGKLYGEYDWDKLPFAHWAGQGTVVAERKLRDYSYSPVNFPPRVTR